MFDFVSILIFLLEKFLKGMKVFALGGRAVNSVISNSQFQATEKYARPLW